MKSQRTSLLAETTPGVWIEASAISKRIQEITLLKDISFMIHPGELVGILGPSGSGKTTLIKAMLQLTSLTGGQIKFYSERQQINLGYVPQHSIVHQFLTVREALEYSIGLRLPNVGEIDAELICQRVLRQLGLQKREMVLVKKISGGQQKRVNLGLELVSLPQALLLDEPTAGLDPATESELMDLFRTLADAGKTILLSTHIMENLHLLDRLLILLDGCLIFDGTPAQANAFFASKRLADLYTRLAQEPATVWQQNFREWRRNDSPPHLRCRCSNVRPQAAGVSSWRQLLLFTCRYALVCLRDLKFIAILLAQAPIISLFLLIAYDSATPSGQVNLLLKVAIASLWFGCINACREIVKERPIWQREQMTGLSPGAYLGSKVIVLGVLAAIQVAITTTMIFWRSHIPGNIWNYFGVLYLTAVCGLCLILPVSALVNNSDRALTALPIILMPQMIFVGAFVQLQGIGGYVQYLTITHWSYEALTRVRQNNAFGRPALMLAILGSILLTLTYLLLRKKSYE